MLSGRSEIAKIVDPEHLVTFESPPFRDDEGLLIDPDTVTLRITAPDGVTTDYLYEQSGSANELTRLSIGRYSLDLRPGLVGEYWFKFIAPDAANDEAANFVVVARTHIGTPT